MYVRNLLFLLDLILWNTNMERILAFPRIVSPSVLLTNFGVYSGSEECNRCPVHVALDQSNYDIFRMCFFSSKHLFDLLSCTACIITEVQRQGT